MDRDDLHKLIISIVTLSAAVFMISLLFKNLTVESDFKKELAAVHSGTIIDKKIVNPKSGLFTSHGTEYYIVIDTDVNKAKLFERTDEKATKDFSVSEDVYLKYNVGDFFDSYNYSSSETGSNKTTVIDGTEYELVPKGE